MWFWLSLVAILFWSGSDFFSKLGSKPDDKLSHWKMVMAVGLFMGLHATVELLRGTPFTFRDILTYLPVSFLYILAMVLGYVGLRYIMLSVSTPICNSSGAVAAVLCYLFLHESMAPIQLVAVVLILVAIFLLSLFEKQNDDAQRRLAGETPDKKYTRSFIAILLPILYCIIDGLGRSRMHSCWKRWQRKARTSPMNTHSSSWGFWHSSMWCLSEKRNSS